MTHCKTYAVNKGAATIQNSQLVPSSLLSFQSHLTKEGGGKMSSDMTKPKKWHVHPAKTQINLGIDPG